MDPQLQESLLSVRDQIVLFLPQLLASILTFLGFWLAARIARFLVRRGLMRAGVEEHVRKLMADIVSLALLVFGFVTALGTLGINIGATIAGLGLTGFALGFALQDIVANTLSGLLLLLYRPFRPRDHIKVGNWEGTVYDIDLRYMTIDTGKDLILIPNRKLFEEAITVFDQGGKARPAAMPGRTP